MTIQLLLWRDEKREARVSHLQTLEEEEEVVSEGSTSPVPDEINLDGKKIARTISRELPL